MSVYRYKAAGLTDPGIVKEANEDSYHIAMGSYQKEYFILAVVADGMGGTEEGALASKSVIAAFINWFQTGLKEVLEESRQPSEIEKRFAKDWQGLLTEVSLELNSYSKAKGYEVGKGAGTTLSGLFVYDGCFYVVNCGDSRVYKQSGKISQITKDHSWAQMARDNGVSEEDIERDPRANQVSRCIGCRLEGKAKGDFFAGKYRPGDRFLLCTDGLRRVLDNETLDEILSDPELNTREKCRNAVGLAKARGETDNITAVIVEIGEHSDENGMDIGYSESTYIETKGQITEQLIRED